MNTYEVCAKCGHVGRNYYIDKIFAVKAESGKEAALKVRNFPRVKHDHKDAIRYVIEINEERYYEIMTENRNDPYFQCENKQQQNLHCELEKMEEPKKEYIIKDVVIKPVYYKKQLVRNPRRYMRYVGREDYAI